MLKMSACVLSLFTASLISLACSSSGLKARGSSAGAGSVANGGQAGSGAVGGAGGTVGAGGVGAGGAVGGTGGTCLPSSCVVPFCAGELQPNTDPCGCPICSPVDAGIAEDSRQDSLVCLHPPCPQPPQTCPAGSQLVSPPCDCDYCAPVDGGTAVDAAPPPDAGVAKDAQDAGTRMPLLHRPAGATCPTVRASGPFICDCAGSDSGCLCLFGECGQDSDCTAGISGRCLVNGPAPITACSYDTCFSDADCPPKTPCDCRDSASSAAPNSCLIGSDCSVDSDCGPGNYCSPSPVSWYGTAYHCHTSSDTCVDDSDCGQFENCTFDVQNSYWSCVKLPPMPP